MLLKNGKHILNWMMSFTSLANSGAIQYNGDTPTNNYYYGSGNSYGTTTTQLTSLNRNLTPYTEVTTSRFYGLAYGLYIGNGTTPVTGDEYCLDNFIDTLNSNIYLPTATIITSANDFGISLGVQNLDESDLVVTECGIIFANSYTLPSVDQFLITRTVFDPIIIKQYDTYTFTDTIKFVNEED